MHKHMPAVRARPSPPSSPPPTAGYSAEARARAGSAARLSRENARHRSCTIHPVGVLRPLSAAGTEGDLPRRYRFPVRPSTSSHHAASSPTGSAAERIRLDLRLAVGPSARRGQGPECLSRAVLLGAASLLQSCHNDPLQPRSPLVSSVSLPALPPPPPTPAPRPTSPTPVAPQVQSLEERARRQFGAHAHQELARLAMACEGALERQRERQEVERAWDLDGNGQLSQDEILSPCHLSRALSHGTLCNIPVISLPSPCHLPAISLPSPRRIQC